MYEDYFHNNKNLLTVSMSYEFDEMVFYGEWRNIMNTCNIYQFFEHMKQELRVHGQKINVLGGRT